MLQKLPIVPAKIKAGNTSEIVLNDIRQSIYYLPQAKNFTKRV